MELQYQIRRGTLEDADRLAEIEAICFPAAEAATRESLAFRLRTFPECFFVAEADGKCIGFINGCVTNSRVITDEMYEKAECHIPDGDYQTIFGLDTLPEYRCHGIAAAMMQRMIDDAKEKGRKGLILTCKDHLIHYYSKFGYQHMGVSASVHGGAVWNDMILEFSDNKEEKTMNVIDTKNAPGAIGPYSQAFEVNGFVFTSGQIPVNPADGTVPEGIAAQAEQSCKNVAAILEAAGTGMENVFKTTCFLADMGDFAAFNEVYAKYFTSKPARSCVAVKTLPKGVLCEVEAIAKV